MSEYLAGFDLGYLSAAIDGEGSIEIRKISYPSFKSGYLHVRPSYVLRARISNNCLDFLEKLQETCSDTGLIRPSRDGFVYTMSNKLFEDIIPYLSLIVKSEHLKVAKRFLEIVLHIKVPYTDEYLEELEQLYLTMKELNKRGKGVDS